MIPSRVLVPLLFALLLPAVSLTFAQNTDGTRVQQTPGIALVKPQAWSKDSEATVLEFSAFVDRRAASNAAAGYYEFQSPGGQKRQVDASKVIKVVVYPDASKVTNLVEQEDRDKLEQALDSMAGVTTQFPATKTYLAPKLTGFVAILEKYDSGQILKDGTWISRKQFKEQQAAGLAELLRTDIERADPPGSFDLESDPKYASLMKLVPEVPRAKAIAGNLNDMNARLKRSEERKRLLAILADSSTGHDAALGLVEKLKALNPSEDPAAALFLSSWETGEKSVRDFTASAEALAGDLEPQLAGIETFTEVPALKAETIDSAGLLESGLKTFRAGSAPAQIKAGNTKAEAVVEVVNGFVKLRPLYAENRLLEAKEILDSMAPKGGDVGPNTSRVIAGLQNAATTKIEVFTKSREEAKSLAEAGKTAEAVAKYEEALTILSDPTVARTVQELKQKTPQAQP